MSARWRSVAAATVVLFLATPACATHGIQPNVEAVNAIGRAQPTDTKSILERLTQQVTIGTTVDAGNGDEGPRALAVVPHSHQKLTEGQLLVCNFSDSAGTGGKGTTLEVLDPTPKSQPVRFVQSASIEGCDADALDAAGYVFVGGLTSGKLAEYDADARPITIYHGKPVAAPFSDVVAPPQQEFGPEEVFVGTTTGGIVSISTGFYGNGSALEVAKGFAVENGSKGELAPSGLQYRKPLDTLYIVDGVTNTIVAFSHASNLLVQDEIVVKPGGKTFKCKQPKTTCATLVYSGSPLDAPMAATILPNGNLIVANTQGTANKLVELTPQGQVLATKVVDSSKTQGVFGLAAAGSNDNNTVLFFTDTNTNTVQELEQ